MNDKEDTRFSNLNRKIAVFTLVALAAVAGAVLLIGLENDLFSQKYRLGFTVDKGTGFSRGMSVKLSGFRIGRVKSISLNEAAKVDIVLQIDKKYQKWIRKDSCAKLVKEGLVGDAIIEVSVGTPALPALSDQDRLEYAKTKALDELAEEIADQVKPVLSGVRDIIGYLNDPDGDIKQSLKNFNVLSRNLELTRKTADAVLVKAGLELGSVSGKLSVVLDDGSLAVKRAKVSLTRLDDKLPALLSSSEQSLKNVERISLDLKQAEEKMLPKLSTLVDKSGDTLQGTNGVLHAVQGIWPISSHLPVPEERQFVPGDSHD